MTVSEMPDDRVLVSIIIPTYNRERLLREAIRSVSAQTFTSWELIVVDDGSTDGTRAYLQTLHDPRIRVIETAHTGNRARLRNIGIADAKGDFLAFLDSDDLWMPNKLQVQVGQLRENVHCRWSYTFFEHINASGDPLGAPREDFRQAHSGWVLPQLIAVDLWIAMPTVMVERGYFVESGGFDETLLFCEDTDAWIRLSLHSEVALIAEPLACVRMHPGNEARRLRTAREYEALMYQRLMAVPGLAPYRSLCRRQLARALVQVAIHRRQQREFREAIGRIVRALARRPLYQRGWLELAKTLVYPMIPSSLMKSYRARRNRLPA